MARLPKNEEPKFDGTMTSIQMVNTLNWYHQNKENKDAQKYIQEYAKKNKIAGSVNTSKSYLTLGWLCRLSMNGNDIGADGEKYIKVQMTKVMEKEKPAVEKVVDTPTISIQDRMREKVAEIAGELEGAIDDYITSDFKDAKQPMSIMHDKAKGMHATKLIEQFKKRRMEFDEVLNTNEKELREGYSNFTKPQLKKLIAYCDTIITDAMKISGEAKQNRKPRKRKMKTPEQLIAKMNWCKKSDEYKLESIPAKQIIGAMQLWVFNVKTRKLGVYHAEDGGGFSVKGSTLVNFSEGKSICKTVRKPEEHLTNVQKYGKVALRNLISNISTKESTLTGRINEDTILLRVL